MNIPIEKLWETNFYNALNEYAEIPESEWNKLLVKLSCLKLKKSECFINSGDKPDKLAFIVQGIFRVFQTTESGDEKTLVFRAENKFLSAYSSFLENTQSRYSIQALEDSCLLYITLEDYSALLLEHPCWQTLSAKYAQLLFIEKEKRESEFLSDDSETRYKSFISKYPTFEKRINQYHIASYLGISPVALSRIRNKNCRKN
jgi:CRP-like cAMP-binding protein